MAGLSSNGLSIKRLQDIRDEITSRLETFFGETINTSEDSIFGQVRDSIAPGESSIWEQLQAVYDSQSPYRATGQQLDDNCALVGVFRRGDSKSKVEVVFRGDNNTIIPIGYTAAVNTSKDEFEVLKQASIINTYSVGSTIQIVNAINSNTYTITIDGVDVTHTSPASSTSTVTVAIALKNAINAAGLGVTAVNDTSSTQVIITSDSSLDAKEILIDIDMSFVEIKSPILMTSKEFGEVKAPANQLTDIKTFITGVSSITNPVAASLGALRETDEQLRIRRNQRMALNASTSVEAVLARVQDVTDVRSVSVLENNGDVVDGNGLNPHSIKVIVEDGADADIAEAIFNSKPCGIDTNGATTVSVEDSQGFFRDIKFQRPTSTPVYITVNLTKFSDYPTDGDSQIKKNLEAYGVANLFAGDDVITSRLYGPINGVQGHQVDSIYIGTSPSPATSTSISIPADEIASILEVNIVVN